MGFWPLVRVIESKIHSRNWGTRQWHYATEVLRQCWKVLADLWKGKNSRRKKNLGYAKKFKGIQSEITLTLPNMPRRSASLGRFSAPIYLCKTTTSDKKCSYRFLSSFTSLLSARIEKINKSMIGSTKFSHFFIHTSNF